MGLRESGLLEVTYKKARQDLAESQQGVYDEESNSWIRAEVFA